MRKTRQGIIFRLKNSPKRTLCDLKEPLQSLKNMARHLHPIERLFTRRVTRHCRGGMGFGQFKKTASFTEKLKRKQCISQPPASKFHSTPADCHLRFPRAGHKAQPFSMRLCCRCCSETASKQKFKRHAQPRGLYFSFDHVSAKR